MWELFPAGRRPIGGRCSNPLVIGYP